MSVASVVHDLPDNPHTGDWQYQLTIPPAVQTTIANAGVIELVYDIEVGNKDLYINYNIYIPLIMQL